MIASRLILAGCVFALLTGCGAVQIKTNMPTLKNWLEKDDKPAPAAYQRPASQPVGQPARPVVLPAQPSPTTASPAQAVAPIPAPPAKRKAVKKPEAQAPAVQAPAETPKPNPWAIAPQP